MPQSGTLIDIPGQFVLKGKFDNAATIRQVRVPFLLFIRVTGAGHTTVPYVLGVEAYLQDIADFVQAQKPTPEAP